MRSSYDVIAVSARVGVLTAAALLAKRGFRVLVVRHDAIDPSYALGDLRLPRAPFQFTAADTPAARRSFAELALHQAFRQRARAHDPAFQVVLPGHRLDLAPSRADLALEIAREFPSVAPALERFFDREEALRRRVDAALDADPILPPTTFFERRAVHRAFGGLAHAELDDDDPLRELPEEHPFRLVMHAPLRFSDAMDADHARGLRILRAFGSWRSGAVALNEGAETVRELLIGSLRAHKAEILERDRIDRIHVGPRGVLGVRLAASGDDLGADHVLLGSEVGRYVGLLLDRHPFEEIFERFGEPVVRYYRFTLNLVVRAETVPAGMAHDVFFVRDPGRPLWGTNCLHVEVHRPDAAGRRLLCVEALLPRRDVEEDDAPLAELRESIVEAMSELVPFLREGLLVVDSPHDGRPPRDVVAEKDLDPPQPWTRGPRTMEPVFGYPLTSVAGLCALPARTPVRGLFLCNDQVAPGLGLEGTLLTARAVASLVGRSDRRRDAFRRGMFRWLR